MVGALRDPAERATDPTLIVRFTDWYVAGESMSRLALHVHGDDAARTHADRIVEAIGGLRDRKDPLSLDELDDEVRAIADSLGLTGRASSARCTPDPLETVVDTTFFAENPA
jgi:hypothetical protein